MKIEIECNGKTTEFKKIIKCIEIAERNREISNIESENLMLFLEELSDTIKRVQQSIT